jgi:hypothetical protein
MKDAVLITKMREFSENNVEKKPVTEKSEKYFVQGEATDVARCLRLTFKFILNRHL